MDFFDIPDDYKPEKPLTMEEMDEITNYLKGHPLFLKEMPEDISTNEHLVALQSLMEEEDPVVTAENLNVRAVPRRSRPTLGCSRAPVPITSSRPTRSTRRPSS
jgi:hypothetical protein